MGPLFCFFGGVCFNMFYVLGGYVLSVVNVIFWVVAYVLGFGLLCFGVLLWVSYQIPNNAYNVECYGMFFPFRVVFWVAVLCVCFGFHFSKKTVLGCFLGFMSCCLGFSFPFVGGCVNKENLLFGVPIFSYLCVFLLKNLF